MVCRRTLSLRKSTGQHICHTGSAGPAGRDCLVDRSSLSVDGLCESLLYVI